MQSRSLLNLSKRGFTASAYSYSNPANPKVYLTVARGEEKLGELVFELYADRQPNTAENFQAFCDGQAEGGATFANTEFHHGQHGLGISGGRFGPENVGQHGARLSDEDLTVRHIKRGQLTAPNSGPNAAGSEFTITFNETPFLDGYQTVFGELVHGQDVLDKLEAGVDRLGNVNEDFRIVDSGSK